MSDPTPEARPGRAARRATHVLVVEPDPLLRAALVTAVSALPGVTLTDAGDEAHGRFVAASLRPDLVLAPPAGGEDTAAVVHVMPARSYLARDRAAAAELVRTDHPGWHLALRRAIRALRPRDEAPPQGDSADANPPPDAALADPAAERARLVELGVDALLDRRYAEARDAFQGAARVAPDDPGIRANLARLADLGYPPPDAA